MTESDNDVNISRFREIAIRGREYRNQYDLEYLGETIELYIKPVVDLDFLPIAAILEEKFDMDTDEAKEVIEEEREAGGDESIDAAEFDEEFVRLMAEVAVLGIDRTQGDVEGESEETLRGIFGISDEEENIGLIGGASLMVAEQVLEITSDADKAEKFRRDGGGE
ncbi:MAG: hypothetical protein ABEI86_09070 [Halobacteriaceae archaeon]